MKELFQMVLENYIDNEKKVDSNSKMYDLLIRMLPWKLETFLKRSDFCIKGSMGKGMKTPYPWVAIMNKSITETTQKGLYIVYLFKRDMSGFYLALSQGITHFERLYDSKKYVYAMKVSKYFASQIEDTSFTNKSIVLGDGHQDLGYGYERATIISKYYSSNNFTNEELETDLKEMIEVYDMIVKHMGNNRYDKIIKNVISGEENSLIKADEAIKQIKETLAPMEMTPNPPLRNLIEVSPYMDRTSKFNRITNPKVSKTDYLKKSMIDARNGLIGEELVLIYEIERLRKLGLLWHAANVKWCSIESDAYGYDIESFDLDTNGNVIPIKIEVKSTVNKLDTEFFISKNELETSRKYNNSYFIYRIYDLNSLTPKFYRACGEIEDNFFVDPVSFKVHYKYSV
ncbi:MAG: DUF3578 domain-containing protein [Anaeroplasmataceae bacterium]|nr:DUF3578 domain-containing protein [Anaeroplasmataceae bacterium]